MNPNVYLLGFAAVCLTPFVDAAELPQFNRVVVSSTIGTNFIGINRLVTDPAGGSWIAIGTSDEPGDPFQFGDFIGTSPRSAVARLNEEISVVAVARIQGTNDNFPTRIVNLLSLPSGGSVFGGWVFPPGRFGPIRLRGNGGYLAKVDKDAQFVWAIEAPAFGLLNFAGADQREDVYFSGIGQGRFGSQQEPGFLPHFAKVSSAGVVQWVNRCRAEASLTRPLVYTSAAAMSAEGHPVFAGPFEVPVTFGGTTLTNGGAFLVELDAATGQFRRARAFGVDSLGGFPVFVNAVVPAPDGGLYLAGTAQTVPLFPARFDNIVPVNPDRPNGGPLAYVAHLGPDWRFRWVATHEGLGLADITSLVRGRDGTLYAGGHYRCAVESATQIVCGVRLGTDELLPITGATIRDNPANGFVAALDTQGRWLWAKSFGGTGQEGVSHLGIDAADNLYVAGQIGSTNAFFDTIPVSASGRGSAFLAKLSSGRAAVVSPQAQADGSLQFRVLGTPGLTNRVETSADLRTWSPLATFVSTSASTLVQVPAPTNAAPQFFRLAP